MNWTEILTIAHEKPFAHIAAKLLASDACGSTAARVQLFVERWG
jgi:hypothetical protein